MKKFLVLVLVLSMVLTASAFAALPIGLELTPTPEDYANTDLSEHKTVIMYLVGDGESTYPDFPEVLSIVNEELEKFNTTLEVTVISWSDAGTMYPLVLTGGDPCDLIFTATWREMGLSNSSPVGGISSQSYQPALRAAWRFPAAQWPVWPVAGDRLPQRVTMATNSAALMVSLGLKVPLG